MLETFAQLAGAFFVLMSWGIIIYILYRIAKQELNDPANWSKPKGKDENGAEM